MTQALLEKARRQTLPDLSGESLGMTWAAWRRQRGGLEMYVLKEDSLLTRPDFSTSGSRRRSYHYADSEDELSSVLWGLYWRERDQETPLADLQRDIRRATNRRCRRERYRTRHEAQMKGRRVRTERRRDGGTMNWIQ